MIRTLRFHLLSSLPTVSGLVGMTLLIVLCNALFPENALLQSYYYGWSIGMTVVAASVGLAAGATQLSVALSMGGRRRDYFGALQFVGLLYATVGTLCIGGMRFIGDSSPLNEGFSLIGSIPLLALLATNYLLFLVGTLAGRAMEWNRVLGVILFIVMIFVITAGVTFFGFLQFESTLWGNLPFILPCVGVAVLCLCEFGLYRTLRRACVR